MNSQQEDLLKENEWLGMSHTVESEDMGEMGVISYNKKGRISLKHRARNNQDFMVSIIFQIFILPQNQANGYEDECLTKV